MRAHAEKGFSYLEVILALGNFALGFAALTSLTSLVGDRNTAARETAAASLIAQTQMEQLKLRGYDGLPDTPGIDGSAGPLDAQGQPSSTGRFTMTWDIQHNVPEVGTKRAVVVVRWTTSNQRPRQITFNTEVSYASP